MLAAAFHRALKKACIAGLCATGPPSSLAALSSLNRAGQEGCDCTGRTHSTHLLLLSEVTGEARPHHGKEAVDPRQGRARGGDPTHFHAVNVAQPVRFSSKLQTCPDWDTGECKPDTTPASPALLRCVRGFSKQPLEASGGNE